jgi:two-component system sensor histidine kinase VicK
VDLNKISFVIDTIIENAIYYTKQDGKILIDCITNPKKLTLFISDTGIGLSFINKIMIFSKFYRSKQAKLMNTDGMGLRLYLSRQIIKQHHGKIYSKSNGLNEGTTFFVELPFRK